MGKLQTPYSVTAPGFYGLNTQDSALDMPPGFAYEATNCVIDNYGRIGSRKGWVKSATTSIAANIECIGELITNTGTSYILQAGGNKLYKLSAGALVELTYGGGGVAPTITASNWQFSSLNGVGYFFQTGHDSLIFDPAVSTTTYRRTTEKTGYLGTVPQANTVLSAFGRLWVADVATDKNTVTWSDIIAGHVWTTGTSGYLNVSKVWTNGSDEIVALASHNNSLFIFGKKQILVYSGADNPTTMRLADTIGSIGCIARDSVQVVGEDLLFLSGTGIRSLMRTIQEKSVPLRDLSKNIRDQLIQELNSETLTSIKSVYSDIHAFYLLSLPFSGKIYCFDMRSALPDGSAKVTSWDGIAPKSFLNSRDRILYIGNLNYLGTYSGYLDNTSTYIMKYYTPHISFSGISASSILKKISMICIGGSGQRVTFKYASDYSTNYTIGYVSITRENISEWGIFEWNIGEFSAGIALDTVALQAGGSGKVLQFGFEATINGYQLSFQRLDILTKAGKML